MPPVGHPALDVWKEASLRAKLTAALDEHNVKFTLLGLFGVAGICLIDGRLPATIVIAVLPGSLTLASSREALAQVCLVLQRYVCFSFLLLCHPLPTEGMR